MQPPHPNYHHPNRHQCNLSTTITTAISPSPLPSALQSPHHHNHHHHYHYQCNLPFTPATTTNTITATSPSPLPPPGEEVLSSIPAVAARSQLVGSVSVKCDRLKQKPWPPCSVSCVAASKIVRCQSWDPSAIKPSC